VSVHSTQPLTEMSTRNIFCGKRRPMRRADNITTFMCRLLEIWEPQPPETVRACPGLYRDCFTFAVRGFGTWSLTLREKLLSEADIVIRGNSFCCGHHQARSSNSAGQSPYTLTWTLRGDQRHRGMLQLKKLMCRVDTQIR
jgi:hypothetical protein